MNFLTTPNVVVSDNNHDDNSSLFGPQLWLVILKEVFLVSGVMWGFYAKMNVEK